MGNASKERAFKVRKYMDSRSSLRQVCLHVCVCVCVLLLLFLNLQCILGVDIDSNFFFFGFLIYVNQGVLAQRRSNFQGNGFPFAAEAARRAAVAPFRVRASNARRVANLNKPRYMDFC